MKTLTFRQICANFRHTSSIVEFVLIGLFSIVYLRSSSENNYRSRNPYRFADEYFTDATHKVPATYEHKGEKCEKIVKDSMVCMVCKDNKTNGKYEQCSYVKQPLEKAYSYRQSSTFGNPREEKKEKNAEEPEEGSYSESSSTRVSDRRRDPSPAEEKPHEYSYPSEYRSEETSIANKQQDKPQDEVQDAPATSCKQVQKDSKTCKVCKDPKNGGTYEKCTYNYQPSDKLYKYSTSKSFGYPDKTSGSSSQDSDKTTGASHESKNFDSPRGSDSTREDAYFGKLAPR